MVKHARTSSCRVLLGYRDDELIIEVTDDGTGLPVPGMAGRGRQETPRRGRPGAGPAGRLMLDDAQAAGSGLSGLAAAGPAGRGARHHRHAGAGHLAGRRVQRRTAAGIRFRGEARIPVPPGSR